MTSPAQYNDVIGSTAVDAEGQKVGRVGQIYLNDATGEPEWVTVSTGLFGTRESFAPLYGAQPGDGELRLAVTKQQIKDAPNVDTDGHLEGAETDTLYQYYAEYLNRSDEAGTDAESVGTNRTGGEYAGRDTAGSKGYGTANASGDDAMTRSEERLNVGTESVPAGRARLRKHVVTENVQQTVPVSHEEVRVEREPITDTNRDAALGGSDITESEHEVTLNAERPVVNKETVPVERVRLGTETVTEQHEINEQVRKEQIEDPDVADRRGRGQG